MKKRFFFWVLAVIIIGGAVFLALRNIKNGMSVQELSEVKILPVETGTLQQKTETTNEKLPISSQMSGSKGASIDLRVAATSEERQLGLSYFKSLPQDQGMLFLFEVPGVYPFWMKGMNFPLDIIWLKKTTPAHYSVVYVAENVSPSTYPETIDPKMQADAVLELNAGIGRTIGAVPGAVLSTLPLKQ